MRGHIGHPGNELVDSLANAAHSSAPTATDGWLQHLSKKEFRDNSDWFWMLFDAEFGHYWDGHYLQFEIPDSPPCVGDLGLPTINEQNQPQSAVEVQLRLATCNVLSLCGRRDDQECGLTGPARQDMLLRQLCEEQITIFAFQETRLRKLHHCHSDSVFLFRSAANDRGHFGMLVGFSKTRPYAVHQTNSKLFFSEDDFSVIHSQPRALIIRVHACALKCIVIAGHAPHTGADLQVIQDWWTDLAQCIPKTYESWPRLLLADANASVPCFL